MRFEAESNHGALAPAAHDPHAFTLKVFELLGRPNNAGAKLAQRLAFMHVHQIVGLERRITSSARITPRLDEILAPISP